MINHMRAAAIELNQQYRQYDWFQMVGVGEECLIIYCITIPEHEFPASFQGVKVKVVEIGQTVIDCTKAVDELEEARIMPVT